MPLRFTELTDDAVIRAFLLGDPSLHLYELGDLDPAFRPRTRWFAALDADGPRALFLLYGAADERPVLLALERHDEAAAAALFRWLAPQLALPFYAHVSPFLVPEVGARFAVESHGTHLRLVLTDRAKVPTDAHAACRLTSADLAEVTAFYDAAFAGHWFVPRMLEHGLYFGLRREGRLVSVAGTHILSRPERLATVGNVATLPAERGRGWASLVTGALCRELVTVADRIGLNVKEDNLPARRCYEGLGFTVAAPFCELLVTGQNR